MTDNFKPVIGQVKFLQISHPTKQSVASHERGEALADERQCRDLLIVTGHGAAEDHLFSYFLQELKHQY